MNIEEIIKLKISKKQAIKNYSNKIPLILNNINKSKNINFDTIRFLVTYNINLINITKLLSKKYNSKKDMNLSYFSNNILLFNNNKICELYKKYKNKDDNILYINVMEINSFG